jgi:hypothetical protein
MAIEVLVIRVRGELLFDSVARTTRAKASERIAFSGFHLFGIEIARVGIATLDDETRHVAMKFQIIVEALLREFDEIANMDGCTFAIELDPDGSLRSLDDSHFFSCWLIFWRVECHDSLTSM